MLQLQMTQMPDGDPIVNKERLLVNFGIPLALFLDTFCLTLKLIRCRPNAGAWEARPLYFESPPSRFVTSAPDRLAAGLQAQHSLTPPQRLDPDRTAPQSHRDSRVSMPCLAQATGCCRYPTERG